MKSLTVQTPGGLTSSLTTTRVVSLSNPTDPLSLATQTDTLVTNGRTYTSTYTQATRLLSTTTPAGRTSTVALDAKGRVAAEQVTGLEAVSYSYDAVGRLSTITQGTGVDARTSTLSYNSKNELVSIMDPVGRTVGFAYDLAGRVTTQTLPDTRTIGYSYDANGNVTAITPPGKPAHTFAYTPVDLEATYSPPSPLAGEGGGEGGPTRYTYNLDQQLTKVTRPDSQEMGLGYEAGGRLSTLTLPGSQVVTYAYHPTTGNLSTITAPGSTLSYAYDGSLLTQSTWSGTVSGSVTRSYDNNFRISSQSVNGGNTIAFGYDNDSLLTSAGSLTIARSPQHGLITGATIGSVSDSRSYSTFGELSSFSTNVSGSPVFSTTYTRDKLGRITQKLETVQALTDTIDYTYDQAGRLTQVKKNGTVIASYLYDSNGNRLSRTTPGGTTLGFYDNQDRLTQYGSTNYGYSANGELQSTTTGGQTTTYQYDVLGNLKSVVGPTGFTIEYLVDGQNRRIGKKLNGTLTQGFLYQNQLNPVAELDGAGNVVSRFVYGTKANVPDYVTKGGTTYRIVSDHLGSPRLVVNTADGTVVQRMDYDEFGNILQDTNPGFQPFGFGGGLYDQHTGLVRFGARDYDSVTGRWTAKDPVDFDGGDSNLYGYVANNPVNITDPNGLVFICSQVRTGTKSTITCFDFTDNSATSYDLTEPANNGNPDDPYGPNGQLPPGQYDALPRPDNGNRIPQGNPLYTTPGRPTGTVIAPNGQVRTLIGPHVGTQSLGCPLFPPTPEGEAQQADFLRRFRNNIGVGGTKITVTNVP
ncbi:MAG: RHS repeat-associated core domain-containing protein [Nitrospiraceae bacterium]